MPTAYLVESIPADLEDLRATTDHFTGDALIRLVDRAQHTLELSAMYWTLRPDLARPDVVGLTAERLDELGAGQGSRLFAALEQAAGRGVRIRILQSPGFGDAPESEILRERYPAQVDIRQLDTTEWYRSGIMHHKLWLVDGHSFYLGSANTDWRSLAQVKELGIVIEDAPEIAADMGRFFETWWRLCDLPPETRTVFDPDLRIDREVPAWSTLVAPGDRVTNPLDQSDLRTTYNIETPMPVSLNGLSAGAFITSSPPEACPPGRVADLDGLLHTIQDARESVCVSVMDYLPLGYYGGQYDEADGKIKIDGQVARPLWWPVLNDALLQAVITRGVHVRLLVSRWAHTSPYTEPFLRALRETARASLASQSYTSGQLDIRWFIMPGWNRVAGVNRAYPEFSRVNHTKYIVTDRRLNIGTSNLSWSYFAIASGTSFNSDHDALRQQLQTIFDRDWHSRYAYPLV